MSIPDLGTIAGLLENPRLRNLQPLSELFRCKDVLGFKRFRWHISLFPRIRWAELRKRPPKGVRERGLFCACKCFVFDELEGGFCFI
jgi:hypothetical protein